MELIAIAKMNVDLNITQKDFDEAKDDIRAEMKEKPTDGERADKISPDDELEPEEDEE